MKISMKISNAIDPTYSDSSQAPMEAMNTAPGGATELAHLMGEVYENAPPAIRNVMIEYLMRPLGVLALAAVANGVFLKRLFVQGQNFFKPSVPSEIAQDIRACDVVALADRAQQVNGEVINEVIKIVRTSPSMANENAAATLAKPNLRRNDAQGIKRPPTRPVQIGHSRISDR